MVRLLASGWLILVIIISCFSQPLGRHVMAQSSKLFLREGCSIQSSAQAKEKGDVLSKNSFQPTEDWYVASVPATVLGTRASPQH